MELYCKTCNTRLTNLPLSIATENELNYRDEAELIEEGKFIPAENADLNFEIDILYLVNEKNVHYGFHKDSKRLNGCCGPSCSNEPNIVCLTCSAEIGVISGDCWMPHFVGLMTDAVSKTPIW